MKSRSDIISGVVLLALCAIGAVSTAGLPPPIRNEVVGPAYLPTAALAVMSFCALLLIAFGWRARARAGRPGENKAAAKALGFFAFYVLYLAALCHLGPALYDFDGFPFRHSAGFAVANTVFLYATCRWLGRTSLAERLLFSVGATALLIVIFSVLFKVFLP
jgi:Na+/melibiose symporter-like transporter